MTHMQYEFNRLAVALPSQDFRGMQKRGSLILTNAIQKLQRKTRVEDIIFPYVYHVFKHRAYQPKG